MNSLHASFWDGRKNVVVIIFDCSILEPAGFVYLSSAGRPAEMVPLHIVYEQSHQSGDACLGFEIGWEWAPSVAVAG